MRIGSFDDEWITNFPKGVIRRKKRSLFTKAQELFNKPRYPLSGFHKYARSQEASQDGMPFPIILGSDAMKPVKGVPKKLELMAAYSIPSEDIKVLYGDGYVLIKNQNLLVKSANNGAPRWWNTHPIQALFVIAALISIVEFSIK